MAAEGKDAEFEYAPSYDDLSDRESLESYAEGRMITPGQYSRNTEVGFIGSQAYYVQDGEDNTTSVSGALMADVLMDELGVEGPDIFYDTESDKLLVEEIPGVPSNQYRASSNGKMLKHLLGRELPGDREEINEAIGLKYFLGDSDIPPNIVVTEHSAAAIDFDRTGEQSENAYRQAREYAEEVYEHFNWQFSEDDFHKTLEGLAEGVDLENLETELREAVEKAPERDFRKDYLVRNSLENFEQFK